MRRILWTLAGIAAVAGAGTALAPVRGQGVTLDEQRVRLREANRLSAAASARSAALERAARAADDAVVRARTEQAAVAARIAAAQANLIAAEARVAIVDRLLAARRDELANRRGPITRLVAALQALAMRPPVAAVAQPGSVSDAVHVRAVLATVVPAVQARTARVRSDVARVVRLRDQAAVAAGALGEGRRRLEGERLALVRLESQQRLRARTLARDALRESDRAIALGEQARDIVDLMQSTELAVARAGELGALDGPLPRPAPQPQAAPAAAPPRRVPAYRLPATGRVVTGYGEVSDRSGVRARGLTLAMAAGTRIVAPAAGRVVYARPFRSYGTIVIIDHGKGWTTLLTGLSDARVARGAAVVRDQPIGRAGGAVTIELRRRGVPVDLVAMLG